MTSDQLAVAAYAALAAVLGAGIGLLMVAILFRPGTSRGATQRLRHVVWSTLLTAFGIGFVIQGFTAPPDAGTTVAEHRGLGIGLGLGYLCAAGWLARRRLRRAHEVRLAAEAARPAPARPAPARPTPARPTPARPGPTRPGPRQPGVVRQPGLVRQPGTRPLWRRTVRFVLRAADYWIGLVMCVMVLFAGTLGANYLRLWERDRAWPTLAVLATVHVAGFLYSQVVSSVATRALNSAVRDDWRIGRRGRFWLATGPCLFLAPYFLVTSPGTGAGLAAQLVALFVGFRHTHGEPAGLVATVKLYRRERQQSRRPPLEPRRPSAAGRAATRPPGAPTRPRRPARPGQPGRTP